MIALGAVSLPFLGERQYLHCTDVFEYFWRTLAARSEGERPVLVEHFRFLRETDRSGSAFVLDDGETPPSGAGKAVVSVVFRDHDSRRRKFILTNNGAPMTARHAEMPLRAALPVLSSDYSGRVDCHDIRSMPDLFVTIVEANKMLHQETLRRHGEDSAIAYRFVACEALPLHGLVPADGRMSLTYELVGLRRAAGHTFTFTAIQAGPGPRPPIRLCFAYRP